VDQPLEIAGFLALTLAVVGSGYMAFAAGRTRALFGAKAAIASADAPAVTILKPLHRDEPGLEAALATVFRQDYAGEVQVVFGLQDPADPALLVAERLRASHPGRDVAVVVDSRLHGANHKVSNLINMAVHARHELIVIADSDIVAPRDWLSRVLAPLRRGEAGAVTCAYFGLARAGLWSRLAAMDLSYRFLPNVAAGVSLGLARPCMGSTIALPREVLRRIGGFEAFADRLADDYAIGESVREAGWSSRVAPVLVGHGCAESSLGELLAHELRWAKTVRGVDPAGFVGSVVTYPLPLALLGVLALQGAPISLGVLALAAASRAWLIHQVEKVAEPTPGAWWLLPARDILSLIVFVGSFFVRVVHWRGTRFRVHARGDLSGV
jgi:ceramide glucosyltransferase